MVEPIEVIGAEGGDLRLARARLAAPRGQEQLGPLPPRNDQFQLASTRLAFSRGENGQIIVRVFDEITGELIRQIPPEQRLRLAARIQAIVKRLQR